MRIALLTCRTLPEPDVDEELLLSALRQAGQDAQMLAWDDPGAEPGDFDLCVLRSTWNYHLAPGAFRRFLARTAQESRLCNPVEVAEWNLHKGYLRELEERGVRIVPSWFLARGARVAFEQELAGRGWSDVVVKPAISAGSYLTRRFRPGEEAEGARFLAEVLRERDALVQPYVTAVERGGERALVWIDGALTHVVAKSPRFAGQPEEVQVAGAPTMAERELLAAALRRVPGDVVYARGDVMPDHEGRPCLSELELLEPSLFLAQHPPALARFVAALVRTAEAAGR